MWRGWGWSSGGGGIGGGGGGEALKTWVRYMSKKRDENLRKINPKLPYPEATSIAQSLFNLVKDRDPLTISSAWSGAQVCMSFYVMKSNKAMWFSNKVERSYWEQWYINLNVSQHPKGNSSKTHHSKVIDVGVQICGEEVMSSFNTCRVLPQHSALTVGGVFLGVAQLGSCVFLLCVFFLPEIATKVDHGGT